MTSICLGLTMGGMDGIPFSRWLRARRVELDQDQDQAANALGIGVGKLRRWEGGELPVKLADARAIAWWCNLAPAEVASLIFREMPAKSA